MKKLSKSRIPCITHLEGKRKEKWPFGVVALCKSMWHKIQCACSEKRNLGSSALWKWFVYMHLSIGVCEFKNTEGQQRTCQTVSLRAAVHRGRSSARTIAKRDARNVSICPSCHMSALPNVRQSNWCRLLSAAICVIPACQSRPHLRAHSRTGP